MKNIYKFLQNPSIAIPVSGAVIALLVWGITSRMNSLPAYSYEAAARGSVSGTITFLGTVVPANEIDLAFLRGGTVASVPVHTGQRVVKGQILASLSNQDALGILNQAKGAYEVAEANLEKAKNGPASSDLAVPEASLKASEQVLTNLYTSIPDALVTAYSKANDAIRTELAPIFGDPESNHPTLTFQTNNPQAANDALPLRLSSSQALNVWQGELLNTTASSSPDELTAELRLSLAHINVMGNLLDRVSGLLDGSIDLSPSTLAAYRSNLAASLAEINASRTSLNSLLQSVAAQQSAVALAEAGLAAKQAPVRPEDLAIAEAGVDAAEGVYQSAEDGYNKTFITAPTDGVITFVNLKAFEGATPNQTVIGMVSTGAFQMVAYVGEDFLNRLPLGTDVNVTFSAIPGSVFSARVVDTEGGSAVAQSNAEYKVTFEINSADSRIRSGLVGSAVLAGEDKENVLEIPLAALFSKDGEHFVLMKKGSSLLKTPVEIGAVGTDKVEITSGLAEGDSVALINR